MEAQTAIITGASTGIVKAITRLFLEKEHNAVMNLNNKNNLLKTYNRFGFPASAVWVAGDVSRSKTGHQVG